MANNIGKQYPDDYQSAAEKNKSKGIYSLAFHVSWKNTTMEEEAVVFEISQK